MGKNGVDEAWNAIVSDIEELTQIGCYERVNFITSLALLGRLRRRAASLLHGRETVVDAGAGPGYSSVELMREAGPSKLILLDPSQMMLGVAYKSLEQWRGRAQAVVGVFESMPLPDSSVDGVISMFAFRDAIDYEEAAREICRVLKEDGLFVILDLIKPDSRLEEIAVKVYITVIPLLAALMLGCIKRGAFLRYLDLVKTIERMPRLSELTGMLSKYFKTVEAEKILPGTALIKAEKPRKDVCP
ncbi:class I SAM-dependent methyltransferase [Stetteria hydrogenophila]